MRFWEELWRGDFFARQAEEQLTEPLRCRVRLSELEQQIYIKTGLIVSFSEDGSLVLVQGEWLDSEAFLRRL